MAFIFWSDQTERYITENIPKSFKIKIKKLDPFGIRLIIKRKHVFIKY